jgi:uncharacterized protein DUF397
MDLFHAVWRKSSYSGSQSNCVEVAVVWRKSSYSGTQTNCVEAAEFGHVVAVRDSKDPAGPTLTFSPAAWTSFVATLECSRPRVRSRGLHPPHPRL